MNLNGEARGEARGWWDLLVKMGVKLYTPTPVNDMLLLRWWLKLQETGDIDRVINKSSQSLTRFLQVFQHPTYLLYTLDKEGEINEATWFTPVSTREDEDGLYHGFWMQEGFRNRPSRKAILLQYITYQLVFCLARSIFITTWQPALIALFIKLGYSIVGMIPNFQGREQYYFGYLTREKLNASPFGRLGERMLKKGV